MQDRIFEIRVLNGQSYFASRITVSFVAGRRWCTTCQVNKARWWTKPIKTTTWFLHHQHKTTQTTQTKPCIVSIVAVHWTACLASVLRLIEPPKPNHLFCDCRGALDRVFGIFCGSMSRMHFFGTLTRLDAPRSFARMRNMCWETYFVANGLVHHSAFFSRSNQIETVWVTCRCGTTLMVVPLWLRKVIWHLWWSLQKIITWNFNVYWGQSSSNAFA